ncbi:hypothetical protein LTR78_006097 [Recurvomyces mirabilis]|uniref:Alpha/beta hydrolase fold-3 domain-containing protein n=1 Tax=Recurvomyces mirabilis TaxID=574656 RepID=A0AAE0WLH2_9PEZI|nr:hypothetical protein LTR78_006097 [Recurvomyces mirabilis]KAK5151940.1 hypothetical protein LTS14_008714 [Recurvomyces mirabilis]
MVTLAVLSRAIAQSATRYYGHCFRLLHQSSRPYSSFRANESRTVRIPCHSNGNIDLNIYDPPSTSQREDVLPRVLLHLPAGPLLRREAVDDNTALLQIAAELSCQVVKINYRLSSEHTYPGPIHDILAAYDWVEQNLLAKRSISRLGRSDVLGRVAVQGELIGGGLAAMLAMTECQKGQPGIIAAVLHNPVVDWVDLDKDLSPRRARKKADSSGTRGDLTAELISLRNHAFQKPEHYFDPFASPMLFLRSSGVEVPSPIHQVAPLSDMAQLAMHTREVSEDIILAVTEQASQSPGEVLFAKPHRRAAKRYPGPALGLKLPPFYITAKSGSPLYTQIQEFVQRLRQSHARQLRGADFGRKVLTDGEVDGLSEVDRQEYEDIDAEARGMVGFMATHNAFPARATDPSALAWLRSTLQ